MCLRETKTWNNCVILVLPEWTGKIAEPLTKFYRLSMSPTIGEMLYALRPQVDAIDKSSSGLYSPAVYAFEAHSSSFQHACSGHVSSGQLSPLTKRKLFAHGPKSNDIQWSFWRLGRKRPDSQWV